MGILKMAMAGAGFTLVLGNATTGGTMEAPPKQALVGFAHTTPDVAVHDDNLRVRSYIFDVADKSPVIKQGLYDDSIGVACSWTLTPKDDHEGEEPQEYLFNVKGHECKSGAEPAKWQEAAPSDLEQSGGSRISRTFDFYGDKSFVGQLSTDINPASGSVRYQTRLWKENTDEVCLKTVIRMATPIGMIGVADVDHGCFKLEHKDFVIKRAIATQPSITA